MSLSIKPPLYLHQSQQNRGARKRWRVLTFLIKLSCPYWHLAVWYRCEACQAGSLCDKLALCVPRRRLRMGWRQGLWSSDSVITEMSVRRKERRRGPEGGGEGREGERVRDVERVGHSCSHRFPSPNVCCLAFSAQLPFNGCTRREHSAQRHKCEGYF